MLLTVGKEVEMQLGNGKLNQSTKKIPVKIYVWENVSREAVKSSQLR